MTDSTPYHVVLNLPRDIDDYNLPKDKNVTTRYHADLPRHDYNLPRDSNITSRRGTGTTRTDKS